MQRCLVLVNYADWKNGLVVLDGHESAIDKDAPLQLIIDAFSYLIEAGRLVHNPISQYVTTERYMQCLVHNLISQYVTTKRYMQVACLIFILSVVVRTPEESNKKHPKSSLAFSKLKICWFT